MEITEKDLRRFSMIAILLIILVLAVIIIRPVIMSIFGGLILAFVFFPIYRKVLGFVKYRSLAAAIVSVIVLAIIVVPIWLFLPLIIRQVFDLFQYTQNLDFVGILKTLFPNSSDIFINQISLTASNALSKIVSSVLNSLVDFLVNFATVALNLLLVAFVFFFALRDEENLREFVSGLSPLNKNQEKSLVKQFKDTTNSIIYGHVFVGILQGLIAGLGLYMFNVPGALVLTVLSIILGILPMLGVGLVYLPVTLYLLISGNNPATAILFLVYNLIFVSSIDNILRSHLVSRKTRLPQVIILIGMVGGTLVFGILGIIIGPLILGYFLTILKAYKEKTFSSFFASEES